MAVPKRKISRSRRGMRRSHIRRLNAPRSLSTCSNCGSPTLPHNLCTYCGYYKKKEIVKTDSI